MSEVPYHAWTHRPKRRGGTDPIIPRGLISSVYHLISAVGENEHVIASGGGPWYLTGYYICNIASTFRYVKLYDKVSTPVLGSDTPAITLGIPPLTAANIGFDSFPEFINGIGIATTSNIADAGTGDVGLQELAINIYYTDEVE